MRKLASIQQIAEVKPIPKADRIVKYRINGWWVVDQKDKYQVGDKVVYVETDAWVPSALAPFLSKGKQPRVYNNVPGERLRTIKLKKQVSQGLILPLSILDNLVASQLLEGLDVTYDLGIQKWEPPIPAQLVGKMKGNFPDFIPKTSQERVQNIDLDSLQGKEFEVTEKLHGSSMTIYFNEGEWGVCSRNIDLKLEDEDNAYVKQFLQLGIKEQDFFKNFAIQGELIGEGINGNQYGIKGTDFYVFNVFNIETQAYLTPEHARKVTSLFKLKYVPVLSSSTVLSHTQEQVLKLAEFESSLNQSQAEGLVFKATDGSVSFKVISDEWLLKSND